MVPDSSPGGSTKAALPRGQAGVCKNSFQWFESTRRLQKMGEIVVKKEGAFLTKAQTGGVALRLGPAEIQIDENLFIGPAAPEEREGGIWRGAALSLLPVII